MSFCTIVPAKISTTEYASGGEWCLIQLISPRMPDMQTSPLAPPPCSPSHSPTLLKLGRSATYARAQNCSCPACAGHSTPSAVSATSRRSGPVGKHGSCRRGIGEQRAYRRSRGTRRTRRGRPRTHRGGPRRSRRGVSSWRPSLPSGENSRGTGDTRAWRKFVYRFSEAAYHLHTCLLLMSRYTPIYSMENIISSQTSE